MGFNVDDIENNSAPNDNLLELNGLKRTWTLCFESSELCRNWCKELEKLKFKTAKKFGDQYLKQDVTFFSAESGDDDDIDDDDDDEENEEGMELIRSPTMTENMMKEIIITEYEQDEKDETVDTNEYSIQFKIAVDGIGLYKDDGLDDEVFDHDITDALIKGSVVYGKYVKDKVVELSNGLHCSVLALQEMGHVIQTPGDTQNGLKAIPNLKSPSVSISY